MAQWTEEKIAEFVQKHFYGYLLRRGSPVPSEAAANLVKEVLKAAQDNAAAFRIETRILPWSYRNVDAFTALRGEKFLELGVYPVRGNEAGHESNRHFALFYTGVMPSYQAVLNRMKDLVAWEGEEFSTALAEPRDSHYFLSELETSLKGSLGEE